MSTERSKCVRGVKNIVRWVEVPSARYSMGSVGFETLTEREKKYIYQVSTTRRAHRCLLFVHLG